MNNITIELMKDLYYLGVNDRETPRFENLWPLNNGVAYNAYLIIDEKTALCDTVKITKSDGFLENFKERIGDRPLDYLVIHHVEPDHAGGISALLEMYPDLVLVGNRQTKKLLSVLYGKDDVNFLEVKENDVLDLGRRKLEFHMTPMCHWPESMVSYEPTDKILFSQDIFGAFGALDGSIFDDEMDYDRIQSEMRRYFSNIIGKQAGMAARALKKLEGLDINMICPVHGTVWRTHIDKIIDAYTRWANYKVQPGVVLVYGTMYGNTEGIADRLARYLVEEGVRIVKVYDASKTHASYIINDIWKYNGLIIGSATYNMGLLPVVQNLVSLLEHYKIENHHLGYFTTYGWGGTANKQLKEYADASGMDVIDTSIDINGLPKDEDDEKLRALAKEMAARINA